MVINPQSDMNILDICQIPCNEGDTPYFILHTGRGILIVNTAKCRSYELAYNEQTNFNVCRSMSVVPIDADDLD